VALALLIAAALLRAALAVATAEGVVGFLSLLAAIGLVEDEEPGTVASSLGLQQKIGDGVENGPVFRPVQAGQKTRELRAVRAAGRKNVLILGRVSAKIMAGLLLRQRIGVLTDHSTGRPARREGVSLLSP